MDSETGAAPREPAPEITVDDLPSVMVAVRRFAGVLGRAVEHDVDGLAVKLRQPETIAALQVVLAHLTPQRRLDILGWLDQAEMPAKHEVLGLIWADTPGDATPNPCQIMRRSLQHLHQSECVRRIFAPERIAHLSSLCEGEAA